MNFQRIIAVTSIGAMALAVAAPTIAQEDEEAQASPIEEVVVTGIRGSLRNAIDQKRNSDNLIEAIVAEDIGKLPDQNLAEVLENVTGVQITRTAGVGTGVQIRGTNANRTEINGVSTVGSGTGRTGIDFEDVSAGIIAGVEVTKASNAKTIEGSVGGTINLKTIRPLELTETLGFVRVQWEDSSLTTDSATPRVSATFGDNWSTDSGDLGVVISASYSEQDVTAFRPRTDRDNFVLSDGGEASAQPFDFLPIQFFVQDYDNFEYETTNIAGSLEFAPNDEVTLFFDAIFNDQDRRQQSSRIQASGISGNKGLYVPDQFETVNFGSLLGSSGRQDLGSIQAAVRGVIPIDGDGSDGNARMSTETNQRESDSTLFRLGADWQINNRLSVMVEASTSSNDTTTPQLNTVLNFINPNSPLDYAALLANWQTNIANGDTALYDSNENGTPFEYDLTGGSLAFGLPENVANGVSSAELLDPANYVLRDVQSRDDIAENEENAFRVDFALDVEWSAVTSVDFGFRWNETSSLRDEVRSSVGLRDIGDSPTGDLFADILRAGPTNFNDADGRSLYVRDFLHIDPNLSANNPSAVLDALNAAILANNAITGSTRGPISEPTSSSSAFFDISEDTNALYVQANFESGIFRGNVGFRWLDTDVKSVGNSITEDALGNEIVTRTTTKGSYDFLLPRLNLVADLTDDLVLRTGWGKDIKRPDFDDLSTSVTFSTSPNPAVNIGNPELVPEEVDSFDVSLEWYFAPGAVVSAGYFHKERTGLHVSAGESPFEDPVTGFRDLTDPCEQGGIFNPIADINVFGPDPGVGVCVPTSSTINGAGATKQKGWEFAFQYDLAEFEDKLGWASGFGFLANYTRQNFYGGESFQGASSRADTIFARNGNLDVDFRQQLLDLSETAYNITVYYEKYGLATRARYTWREAFRTNDTAAGASVNSTFGFDTVTGDRGQLNLSATYAVNDNLNVGVEVVNLTESDVDQYCVNDGALLCFQGLTDRRITFGGSYRF